MKKKVFIYEKDNSSLKFLKDFFKGNPTFSASFFTNLRELKKTLRARPPYAIIVGSPECLEKLKHPPGNTPVVAMVSTDVTKGMRSVVRNDIEYYLLRPYLKSDFDYKLKALGRKSAFIETLSQEKEDLQAVANLAYSLSSTMDPEEILYMIVKKISEIIPVTRCSILSVSFGDDRVAEVVSSFESHTIKRIRLDINKYPEIEKALSTKRAVVVKDAMKDPLMNKVRKIIEPIGIRSIAVIPIIFRDEVIGTLFLRTSRKGHQFTEREVKLCSNIATASSNSLNNAFLFEKIKSERAELKKLAITDFLTGLFNVRYFYLRLSDEFSRAARYEAPLSCLMLDIDFFKKINDTYGHRTGDMVLREFAAIVKKHVRKSDVLARYGGEEFIILLPHTGTKGAVSEAQRIADVIRAHKFRGIRPSDRITVSIGVASYPDKRVTSQDVLINFADDALLKAKQKGRDQIILHK